MARYAVRDIGYRGKTPLPVREENEQRRMVKIVGVKPYNFSNSEVKQEGILLTLDSPKGDVSKCALIGDDVISFLGYMCVDLPEQVVGREIRAHFVERDGKYFVASFSPPKQRVGRVS